MPVAGEASGFQRGLDSLFYTLRPLTNLANAETINYWVAKFHDLQDNHSAPVALTSASALLVTAVWGTHGAKNFLVATAITYPWTYTYLRDFIDLNNYKIIHDIAFIAIPMLCATIPVTALVLMPFQLAMLVSQKMRERDIVQKLQETTQNFTHLTDEKTQLTTRCESLVKELRLVNEKLDAVNGELRKVNNQFDTAKKDFEASQTTDAESIETLKGRLTGLIEENTALMQSKEKIKEALASQKELTEEQRRIVKGLQESLQTTTALLEQANQAGAELQAEHSALLDQIQVTMTALGLPLDIPPNALNTLS